MFFFLFQVSCKYFHNKDIINNIFIIFFRYIYYHKDSRKIKVTRRLHNVIQGNGNFSAEINTSHEVLMNNTFTTLTGI